jgi:hypothetical protein
MLFSPSVSAQLKHLAVKLGGITYLAENERDMGHPSFVRESGAGRLRLPDRVDQFGQASWIHIADRDPIEIIGTEVHHMKSRVFGWRVISSRCAGLLPKKNGNAMLAYAVEQLCHGLVVKVGQVCAIERGISRQALRQIKTERQFALKPWLDRVPISGKHLWRQAAGKRGDVLIEDLGH